MDAGLSFFDDGALSGRTWIYLYTSYLTKLDPFVAFFVKNLTNILDNLPKIWSCERHQTHPS